jgi:hypothetical protein
VFTGDPSVGGRLRAFDDAIEKLLWPEQRGGKGSIRITSRETFVTIPEALVPKPLRPLTARTGMLKIGPIPKGTPIKLLANVEPDLRLLELIPAANATFARAATNHVDFFSLVSGRVDDDLLKADVVRGLISALMAASTCPDLIEDRGHEFGADLADADKRALIEFLKTL